MSGRVEGGFTRPVESGVTFVHYHVLLMLTQELHLHSTDKKYVEVNLVAVWTELTRVIHLMRDSAKLKDVLHQQPSKLSSIWRNFRT